MEIFDSSGSLHTNYHITTYADTIQINLTIKAPVSEMDKESTQNAIGWSYVVRNLGFWVDLNNKPRVQIFSRWMLQTNALNQYNLLDQSDGKNVSVKCLAIFHHNKTMILLRFVIINEREVGLSLFTWDKYSTNCR